MGGGFLGGRNYSSDGKSPVFGSRGREIDYWSFCHDRSPAMLASCLRVTSLHRERSDRSGLLRADFGVASLPGSFMGTARFARWSRQPSSSSQLPERLLGAAGWSRPGRQGDAGSLCLHIPSLALARCACDFYQEWTPDQARRAESDQELLLGRTCFRWVAGCLGVAQSRSLLIGRHTLTSTCPMQCCKTSVAWLVLPSVIFIFFFGASVNPAASGCPKFV